MCEYKRDAHNFGCQNMKHTKCRNNNKTTQQSKVTSNYTGRAFFSRLYHFRNRQLMCQLLDCIVDKGQENQIRICAHTCYARKTVKRRKSNSNKTQWKWLHQLNTLWVDYLINSAYAYFFQYWRNVICYLDGFFCSSDLQTTHYFNISTLI